MKNKETIFSKNNYDIQLEEILDKKDFSDEVKSLILNILYKIEISYKDYSKIKVGVKLKGEIISEIIEILDKNCDSIEIINPEITKSKFIVDKSKKIIKTFPTEISLLQALYYIRTKETKQIKKFSSKAVTSLLNNGYAINNTEVIRDFNGWSWNNIIDDKFNKYYNLIYQNLLLLIGNELLEDIIKSDNVLENLYAKIDEIYGEKKANDIVEKVEKCCILIYINNNKKNQEELKEYLEKKQSELDNVLNKSEYISTITEENNKNMRVVSKVEAILKSKTLIEKKLKNKLIKEKYLNVENYKNYLKTLRKSKLRLIKKNSNLINPFEYVKNKNILEKEVKTLNYVKQLANKRSKIYDNLIDLQRKVIFCLYKKIEVYDLKKELINLIYEVRYYNLLPIESDKCISSVKELEVDLRNMQKKLTAKLNENKVIDIFAKDYSINYNIIKYIFRTKMININKILINLKYENKKLCMEYYDENILENVEKLNFSEDDVNELCKKTNKKMRIII